MECQTYFVQLLKNEEYTCLQTIHTYALLHPYIYA